MRLIELFTLHQFQLGPIADDFGHWEVNFIDGVEITDVRVHPEIIVGNFELAHGLFIFVRQSARAPRFVIEHGEVHDLELLVDVRLIN
jgi:hypothetical protein